MVKAIAVKPKVYIVAELNTAGDEVVLGGIDSVWNNVDDAIARRDTVEDNGATATIIVRKVR